MDSPASANYFEREDHNVKRDNASLWSALLPDKRLQHATSQHYRVTTAEGNIKELEIERGRKDRRHLRARSVLSPLSDSHLIAILKLKGWTFERIGDKS